MLKLTPSLLLFALGSMAAVIATGDVSANNNSSVQVVTASNHFLIDLNRYSMEKKFITAFHDLRVSKDFLAHSNQEVVQTTKIGSESNGCAIVACEPRGSAHSVQTIICCEKEGEHPVNCFTRDNCHHVSCSCRS